MCPQTASQPALHLFSSRVCWERRLSPPHSRLLTFSVLSECCFFSEPWCWYQIGELGAQGRFCKDAWLSLPLVHLTFTRCPVLEPFFFSPTFPYIHRALGGLGSHVIRPVLLGKLLSSLCPLPKDGKQEMPLKTRTLNLTLSPIIIFLVPAMSL